MLEKLRVWAIHKLNGVTPEEIKLPVKAYVAVPKKISVRMVLREGNFYQPALIQQRLSYQLADALVDGGFINFLAAEVPDGDRAPELRAELWVVKKENEHGY